MGNCTGTQKKPRKLKSQPSIEEVLNNNDRYKKRNIKKYYYVTSTASGR